MWESATTVLSKERYRDFQSHCVEPYHWEYQMTIIPSSFFKIKYVTSEILQSDYKIRYL